jgi:hypothetical protein
MKSKLLTLIASTLVLGAGVSPALASSPGTDGYQPVGQESKAEAATERSITTVTNTTAVCNGNVATSGSGADQCNQKNDADITQTANGGSGGNGGTGGSNNVAIAFGDGSYASAGNGGSGGAGGDALNLAAVAQSNQISGRDSTNLLLGGGYGKGDKDAKGEREPKSDKEPTGGNAAKVCNVNVATSGSRADQCNQKNDADITQTANGGSGGNGGTGGSNNVAIAFGDESYASAGNGGDGGDGGDALNLAALAQSNQISGRDSTNVVGGTATWTGNGDNQAKVCNVNVATGGSGADQCNQKNDADVTQTANGGSGGSGGNGGNENVAIGFAHDRDPSAGNGGSGGDGGDAVNLAALAQSNQISGRDSFSYIGGSGSGGGGFNAALVCNGNVATGGSGADQCNQKNDAAVTQWAQGGSGGTGGNGGDKNIAGGWSGAESAGNGGDGGAGGGALNAALVTQSNQISGRDSLFALLLEELEV